MKKKSAHELWPHAMYFDEIVYLTVSNLSKAKLINSVKQENSSLNCSKERFNEKVLKKCLDLLTRCLKNKIAIFEILTQASTSVI